MDKKDKELGLAILNSMYVVEILSLGPDDNVVNVDNSYINVKKCELLFLLSYSHKIDGGFINKIYTELLNDETFIDISYLADQFAEKYVQGKWI